MKSTGLKEFVSPMSPIPAGQASVESPTSQSCLSLIAAADAFAILSPGLDTGIRDWGIRLRPPLTRGGRFFWQTVPPPGIFRSLKFAVGSQHLLSLRPAVRSAQIPDRLRRQTAPGLPCTMILMRPATRFRPRATAPTTRPLSRSLARTTPPGAAPVPRPPPTAQAPVRPSPIRSISMPATIV